MRSLVADSTKTYKVDGPAAKTGPRGSQTVHTGALGKMRA